MKDLAAVFCRGLFLLLKLSTYKWSSSLVPVLKPKGTFIIRFAPSQPSEYELWIVISYLILTISFHVIVASGLASDQPLTN